MNQPRNKNKAIIIALLVSLIVIVITSYLFSHNFISMQFLNNYQILINKIFLLLIIILSLLLIKVLVSFYIIDKIKNPTPKFYAYKVINLMAWFLFIIFGLSLLFSGWTASLTSLGFLSIVAGIALQSPVSNFFAWIVLLFSPIYRVGDRVKIDNATGDVIEVGYFYTTLWEFGGEYVSNDIPSGRIIKLPNSKIFSENVYNYSWPLFPYIWSEIYFYVAYDADFDFIENKCKTLAIKHIGVTMKKSIQQYREVLSKTPVDDVEVKDEPRIFFTADTTTWIKVTIRFLSDPKKLSETKKDMLLEIIKELRTSPEKVRFPDSNAR